MALIENGNNASGIVNVDANFDLMTTTPQVNTRYGGATGTPNFVGASRLFCENDPGLLTGISLLSSPYVTYENNLQIGSSTPLFDYEFNGTAQDTSMWYCAFSTMTITQSGGFLLLNASNIGTTGSGAYITSRRFFNLTANAGLKFGTVINITQAAAANEIWAIGLGTPASTTALPTDGVWIQYSSAGLFGVISSNGVITQTGALPVVSPISIPINANKLLQIRINNRVVHFLYDGNFIGSLPTPIGLGMPFMTASLPVFAQYVNTGTVSGGTFMQLKIGMIAVDQFDSQLSKPYSHIQAGKGLMAYQGLQGGTMGSSAKMPNNAAPDAGAALANASAAFLGLGGQFSFQPTLTSGSDGILCSYANPVGSINQTPRTLYITGVKIQSVVTILFIGGPVIMFYSLAFGHTTVSLAQTETTTFATASTKAPRRIPLGLESFVITSPIGQLSGTPPVTMQFTSPVVINPGEFVAIVAKNIGTVTSAGVITSLVTFDGYFE